jgi:diguanylate cyclase (GGDEF)-like protein
VLAWCSTFWRELTRAENAVDPDGERYRFWRAALAVRACTAVALVVTALLVPGTRHVGLVVVLAVVGALPVTLLHPVRRDGGLPALLAYPGFIAVLVALGFEPHLLWPVLVLLAADLSGIATLHDRRHAAVLAISATPVIVLAAVHGDRNQAVTALVAWGATAATAIMVIGETGRIERRARQSHAELVNGLQVVIWQAKEIGNAPFFVSANVVDMFGYPRDRFYQPGGIDRIVHPEDRLLLATRQDELSRTLGHDLTYRVIDSRGRTHWLREHVLVEVDDDGNTAMVRGMVVDITGRMDASARRLEFTDVVEAFETPIVVVRLDQIGDDSTARIMAVNQAAARLADRDAHEMAGYRLERAYPELARPEVVAAVGRVARGGPSIDLPMFSAGDDWTVAVMVHVFPLPDQCAGMSVRLVTVDDIPAVLDEPPVDSADEVTGLPDRAQIHQFTHDAIADARLVDDSVALLMVMVDELDEVSSSLGDRHRDNLLQQVSDRLTSATGEAVLGRLDTDQFAVVTRRGADQDAAVELGERIAQAFNRPLSVDGLEHYVRVSVGVALFPEHASQLESLLQRADAAMHTAHANGSGVAIYTAEADRSSIQRVALMGELREAITTDQFVVYYQPIIDVRSGEIVSAEALVRWQHPDEGLLLPNEFLSLAEQANLVAPLTQLVVRHVIDDVSRWRLRGYSCSVAVNLGMNSLLDESLISWLGETVGRFADGSPIQVEITERDLLEDPVEATERLLQLRGHGIEVSIDDFGTGYSSLSMIRGLPINELKVDRSFMHDLADGDTTLVRSIIELGHNLGVRVVAEGVETPAMLERVTSLGCDRAQGFLIARPMDSHDLERALDSGTAIHIATPSELVG